MGLGLNPSPPGQRVLYSATKQKHENISFCEATFVFTVYYLWCVQELDAGQSSQGFPQAFPSEQQQEARVTPTPISALQEILPSPRGRVSKKQLPTRVSETNTGWNASALTYILHAHNCAFHSRGLRDTSGLSCARNFTAVSSMPHSLCHMLCLNCSASTRWGGQLSGAGNKSVTCGSVCSMLIFLHMLRFPPPVSKYAC